MNELFTIDCSSDGVRMLAGRAAYMCHAWEKVWQDEVKQRAHQNGLHVGSNTREQQKVKQSHTEGDWDQQLALMNTVTKLVFIKHTEFLG
jgi:hypothetical protein